MTPKAIQTLIPSGDSNGIKILEIIGWSGKCYIVPRPRLKELKDRPETNQPGLYLLFGYNEDTGKNQVYIGESENFYNRISSHDSSKDFWNKVIIFTGGLNRAFVKYLEYRATLLATEVNRVEVQNRVQPQENSLSEFEKVSADQYFENIQFILSVLDYDLFDSIAESMSDNKIYYLKTEDSDASAQLLDDGKLNVLSGSRARIREAASLGEWAQTARKRFADEGVLISNGDDVSYKFTKDVLFKSPSAAAATIAGRPINGWTAWKDESGNTLDENLRR